MELLTLVGEHHEIGDQKVLMMTMAMNPLSGAPKGLHINPLGEEREVATTLYHKMQ